jgi:3-dehydroquinate dehydratase-2
MDQFIESLKKKYANQEVSYFQSNVEGEIINELQRVGFSFDAILLNAGGYTHTSIAIADAVKAIDTPVIEVHLSNIFAREEFRKHSYLSPVCKAVISGFGLKGYELAIESLLK